jgi:hypothetical protein
LSPLVISLLAGALMLLGAVAGTCLRRALPDHHLGDRTKEIVRLGAGLIAAISALVLGFLINSASIAYSAQRSEVERMAADLILLDHMLDGYGPEARPIRALLRQGVDQMVHHVWQAEEEVPLSEPLLAPGSFSAQVFLAISVLPGGGPVQSALRAQAMQVAMDIARARLILYERAKAAIPWPIVAVLVFWFTGLFASFCLFAPLNPTGVGALIVIALSASAALFLYLEMGHAFSGLMRISRESIASVLSPLGP